MLLPREREHRRTVLEAIVLVGSLALITSFFSVGAWPSELSAELETMVDEVVNRRLEETDEVLTRRAERELDAASGDRIYAGGSVGGFPAASGELVLESVSPSDVGNPG